MGSSQEVTAETERLVERYRQGAILYHQALELDLKPIWAAADEACLAVMRELDALFPDGGLLLAPLLDDPDAEVAVMVACHLFDRMRERCLAVLREINARGMSEASLNAFRFLLCHDLL